MDHRPDLDTGAARIINQLAHRYAGSFDRDRIEELFHDTYDRLGETARITIFLPVLAEKLTVRRLDALVRVGGKLAKRVPEVDNAGRAQLAAALTAGFTPSRAGPGLPCLAGGSLRLV